MQGDPDFRPVAIFSQKNLQISLRARDATVFPFHHGNTFLRAWNWLRFPTHAQIDRVIRTLAFCAT